MFGTAEERFAQAEARIGKTIREKYRIEGVLGVGGMAAVYAATHRNGRQVAVKILNGAASSHAETRKRFVREGLAANSVKHPGAVVVIDDDITEDGAPFLVMELLDGHSVERLWHARGKQLPPPVVLAMAFELCGVLDAAHQAGIVHRDIKPENLFLTRQAQLKVLDFGLARLRDQPKLTAMGMVFGTPAFMAPEQAKGTELDARADLWAVGATMFTLLSGETVHKGASVQELLVNVVRSQPRSLGSVLEGLDPRIVALVDRALAVDREQRWPTAAAMRQAVGETCAAIFGASALRLPSADALMPRVPHPPPSGFHIADLTPSVDLADGEVPKPTTPRAPPQRSPRWEAPTIAHAPPLAGHARPARPNLTLVTFAIVIALAIAVALGFVIARVYLGKPSTARAHVTHTIGD